ncbi:MAG: NAD-dependent epimerase/dehydratase family protein [Chloroflexi bacterium]|nr:NAD-dependent epimerase/dehydratase family protein [Chloroflexota bacterium]
MVESSKIVAVTGASGYIGARLLRELEEENLERLVAIDIKPPPMPVHNVAVYRQDVGRLFDGPLRQRRVTTLVHLAFVPNRGRNRREVREIRETNLRTMHMVLDSCARAGVQHVIYLSSHTVYGARRDNAVPLTERAPLRPMPDFPSGYDKFLSDQILESFAERHPDIKVTLLRCCAVLGPSASADIEYTMVRGASGPLEVHVIFLDNGRSTLAKDPVLKEALYCVKCGSCLFECPIFQMSAGHFGGTAYFGGVGSVLSAYIADGFPLASAVAYTCLRCGRCTDVCPFSLDTSKLIIEMRHRITGMAKGGHD